MHCKLCLSPSLKPEAYERDASAAKDGLIREWE